MFGKSKLIKNRAFTLIEVLVVIAILGLLAVMILISLKQVKVNARDITRLSDINNYKQSLIVCFDATGAFPDCQNGNNCNLKVNPVSKNYEYVSSIGREAGVFQAIVLNGCPSFSQSVLPNDPVNLEPLAYYYYYFGSSNCDKSANRCYYVDPKCRGKYVLMTNLESIANPSAVVCSTDGTKIYGASSKSYWIILNP